MTRAALLFLLVACATNPTIIVQEKVRVERVKVPVPCAQSRPPLPPIEWCENCDPLPVDHGAVVNCDGLSWKDCEDITTAAWSDYGQKIGPWVTTTWAECKELR